ncbi:MAG: hypoxanthine phosphoribosyltransferase [Trueperaceae bacterium]
MSGSNVFVAGDGAVQLDADAIARRVAELGEQISRDYQGLDLHLICVLNGAFVFMADLVRAINLPLTVDFLSVTSYGSRTESSGEVRLLKDLEQSLKGRHVIIVEDIIDTGLTMQYLVGYMQGRNPASVKVATLLAKPSRRMVDVPIDYVGFTIEDAFVYGYGLDVSHKLRNLPFVTSQKA